MTVVPFPRPAVKPSFTMQAHQLLRQALEASAAHGVVIFAVGPDGKNSLQTLWLPDESINGSPHFDLVNGARVALDKYAQDFLE